MQVWNEMNQQIMNYIRGKVFESSVCLVLFIAVNGHRIPRDAVLLGDQLAFRCCIPFVGAALVTISVAAVALFQFKLKPNFGPF